VVTLAAGYALTRWLPEAALQLVVGGLLLAFGLQWLRKAVLRASGRKAVHDEDQIFRDEVEAARGAGARGDGALDGFAFAVSYKGVFLEGAEVVFIVLTFGANAGNLPAASLGAAAAVVVVLALAVALRRPLAMVDENLLKYVVGLMLASFGTFWAVEGLEKLVPGGRTGSWPGGELALLVLIAAWFVLTRVLVAVLRRGAPATRADDKVAA
jgi:uncharacterized membrane protein